MALRTYIKGVFKPKAVRRAKAMRRAKETARKVADPHSKLEAALGYKFKNREILSEALTHPVSVGASKGRKIRSNQRLEFLGDAVLQSVISAELFEKFPEEEEGDLTKNRVALTRGSFLAEMSRSLGIPDLLVLPKGMESLRKVASAAEDSFEAVVGAIFVDGGFEKARKSLRSLYGKKLDSISDLMKSQNPKGRLQELAARFGEKVDYVLLSQSGPDHKKVFEVEARIGGEPFGKGSGASKKAAECGAAAAAIVGYEAYLSSRKSPLEIDENF